MKTRTWIIVVSLSLFVSIPFAFASENLQEPINQLMPNPSPLKHQLGNDLDDIKCPNKEHVLIQRPNEKLACVTPYALAKLEWVPVDKSLWSVIVRFEQPFGIFAYLSKTQNVESVRYDKEMNSIMIHVISDKSEKLSVNVNRAILESGTENCQEMPPWSDYLVLLNGKEVAYEKRLTTDHYRYLEIQIDLPVESGEYRLRGASDIHDYYDVQFDEDSMIVEIIGTCLI